jgi:tRNA-specific 2-thiouridylase
MSKQKVIVGMSGGVDSAVTAYILKEQGFDVIGVTMKTWGGEDGCAVGNSCCGVNGVNDARIVALRLGIPYYVLNFEKEFKNKVIDYFIKDYEQGITPNPCIACNKHLKWGVMLRKAMELNADYVSTGHYARVISHRHTGRYTIQISDDKAKDQTYVLYNLSQDELKRTLMPLGDYNKTEVRAIAKKIGLVVADKKDSQDVCFITKGGYGDYVATHSEKIIKEGDFVNAKGEVLGRHKGILYYTIGQRKSLGISSVNRLFVVNINKNKNEIELGDDIALYRYFFRAKDINFMSESCIEGRRKVLAKIRYSHKPAECIVEYDELHDELNCEFLEAQRAITPGQAVVFYDGSHILAGGTIK